MDEEILKKYIKAGKISVKVKDYAQKLVKPDANLLDVANEIENRIAELGGELAFPVNISINDIAAHYTPTEKDETKFGENDVAKIDVGVHIDGYIADTAITIDLSGRYSKMLEATEDALEKAMKCVKAGTTTAEVGKIIQKTIREGGFKPIENLTGHGLDRYNSHTEPSIPNIEVYYQKKIEAGMVIAIEPFATEGVGRVVEGSSSNIFSFVSEKPVRLPVTRDVLKEIKKYQELPFAERWLAAKIPATKLSVALRELLSRNIIKSYPPLREKSGCAVSQFEHTLIVMENECIVTTQ